MIHNRSASAISSEFKVNSRSVGDPFSCLTNRSTYAVTRSSRESVLYLSLEMTDSPTMVTDSWAGHGPSSCLYFSTQQHSVGITISCWGQSTPSTSLLSHSSPQRHILLVANSVVVMPLEGMSAGFSRPGQWLQHSTRTSLRISFTRFCVNCFHSFSWPHIQNSATFESVKHLGGLKVSCNVKASVTLDTSRARSRADNSSSFITVWRWTGATRVLETTNYTDQPMSVWRTRYTTAAYALVDASQNPNNSYDFTSRLIPWR